MMFGGRVDAFEGCRSTRPGIGSDTLQFVGNRGGLRRFVEVEWVRRHAAVTRLVVAEKTSTSSSAKSCAFRSASGRPLTWYGSSSWRASLRTNMALNA